MRKKKLFMLLALVLCATAVIFICGCQDKSKPASTAAASAAITDSGDNEITTVAATKTTKKSSTTKKKKYDKEAPWESFDMYGLPDKLDLLKKDKGDVLVLVNKLHAVSKNYKPTDMVAIKPN